MDIIPVSIKVTWLRSSLIYNASSRQEEHEYNRRDMNTVRVQHEKTSEARARHEQHKCKMSAVWVDTCGTRTIQVRNECYTNDTSATRLKILILVTTRVKSYLHNPTFTICQGKDYKERNDLILRRTILSFGNALLPCQSASEKCSTKTDICNGKSYIKNLYTRLELQMLVNILFSKNYWKLGKVNARFWKNIENIGKVTWDSFQNFAYYLNLKSFPWKQDIFETTNVTKLTKSILESCYRVLRENTKTNRLLSRVLESWPTFDIQIDITLAIFWDKLQSNTS